MSDNAGTDVFDDHLAAWAAWQQAPWGRVRYRVVQETLRRTCTSLGERPLRVLDVGGGDGGDALPLARSGHEVLVLDHSAPLLDQARDGARRAGVEERFGTLRGDLADLPRLGLGDFDLVVCHNVVHYRDDTAATVEVLAGAVADGGAISLMAPNPPAEVLTAAIRREDLHEATDLLSATTLWTRTFEHPVRRVTAEEAETALRDLGFSEQTRYGIRCVTDFITDDERKSEPAFYADLEALELALCDREPFLRTARMWQLVARRLAPHAR